MPCSSFVRVSDDHGRSLILPAFSNLISATKSCEPLIPSTVVRKNRLSQKRIQDKAKDRMASVKPRPQSVAVTVSRYSSQIGPVLGTPSTPPSPDQEPVAEDLLTLGRTVKRRKINTQSEFKLVNTSQMRLSSIKT